MKFVADDGKVFDTMEECQEYEYQFSENAKLEKEIRRNVVFYDWQGNAVKFTDAHGQDFLDNLENIDGDIDTSAYIKITGSDELCSKLAGYCYEEIGVRLPNISGMYRWDSECEGWISIDVDIKYFCERWSQIYPNMRIFKEG